MIAWVTNSVMRYSMLHDIGLHLALKHDSMVYENTMLSLDTLALIYCALIGGCIGSFLNVVIYRLPKEGASLVRPPSGCPVCEQRIRWYDNIPVLSYLLLRGRCRGCSTRIGLRYPMVELLTALLWVAVCLRFGVSWQLVLWLPLVSAMVALVFLDIDHWWLPDVITLPAMAWALAGSFLPGGIAPQQALAGLGPSALLLIVAWAFEKITGREGLGLGDVKLLAVIGLSLGFVDGMSALVVGSLQGAIIGTIVSMLGGHQTADTPKFDDGWKPPPRAIPFGPFLILGWMQVVLLPQYFADLPGRFGNWLLTNH